MDLLFALLAGFWTFFIARPIFRICPWCGKRSKFPNHQCILCGRKS